ncbi:MAG: divalent-cation tolerance protein CutA [Alphaproteobacteria bacterium]|nr:divalent-cation tolerance protein CutA [Alphaproteobacteria bacterium]
MAYPPEHLAYLIYITVPTKEEALLIARSVIQEKLAACANILPQATSVYEWQGTMEQTEETVLILKSTAKSYRDLEQRVIDLHSYECPCIVALPIQEGHSAFLSWIKMQSMGQST